MDKFCVTERWKWNLSRLLYERGFSRKKIVDLLKVIDLMMTLPPELQNGFENKLSNYQEETKMPLLMNIEKRAIERTTKELSQKYIITLLEKNLGNLPENLVKQIRQLEDINILEQLFLESISVKSIAEFQALIEPYLSNRHLQK